MITLIKHEFTVDVSIAAAWAHLSAVENWPSWAKHIKSVDVTPKGELPSDSSGIIHLNNGIKSEFRMTEFNPTTNWKWVGPFHGSDESSLRRSMTAKRGLLAGLAVLLIATLTVSAVAFRATQLNPVESLRSE